MRADRNFPPDQNRIKTVVECGIGRGKKYGAGVAGGARRPSSANTPASGVFDRRAEVGGNISCQSVQFCRLINGLCAARFDTGEIQACVHQLEKTQAVSMSSSPALGCMRVLTQLIFQRAIYFSGVGNSWLRFEKSAVLARRSSAPLRRFWRLSICFWRIPGSYIWIVVNVPAGDSICAYEGESCAKAFRTH